VVFRVDSGTKIDSSKIIDQISANGEQIFDWRVLDAGAAPVNPTLIFEDSNILRLIKVQKQGFQPAGKWVSIFDAEEAKVLGRTGDVSLSNGQLVIEIKMDP
jgi:hypothetical protein